VEWLATLATLRISSSEGRWLADLAEVKLAEVELAEVKLTKDK
jgi:hypothetical protein